MDSLHIHFLNYKICVNDNMFVHEYGGDPKKQVMFNPKLMECGNAERPINYPRHCRFTGGVIGQKAEH